MTVNATPIDWEVGWKNPALPSGPFAKDKASQRVTLIPYGCTKFRVSMFPVSERPERATGMQGRPEQRDLVHTGMHALAEPRVVQEASGYNSWPMIVSDNFEPHTELIR